MRIVVARCQVDYAGRLTAHLPLALRGTAWQRTVWDALVTIPYGTTVSYGALAARIGHPKAARAVGSAPATSVG